MHWSSLHGKLVLIRHTPTSTWNLIPSSLSKIACQAPSRFVGGSSRNFTSVKLLYVVVVVIWGHVITTLRCPAFFFSSEAQQYFKRTTPVGDFDPHPPSSAPAVLGDLLCFVGQDFHASSKG